MIISLVENPDLWLIASVILIIFEIFIGSLVFFLPIGISAFIVGLILKFQLNMDITIISSWSYSLLLWGLLSILLSFIIQRYFNSKDKDKDINKY
tara:strand:- start:310 stop:594 length:285 start_codon:yes stop_codon:yes gene_type:complete